MTLPLTIIGSAGLVVSIILSVLSICVGVKWACSCPTMYIIT